MRPSSEIRRRASAAATQTDAHTKDASIQQTPDTSENSIQAGVGTSTLRDSDTQTAEVLHCETDTQTPASARHPLVDSRGTQDGYARITYEGKRTVIERINSPTNVTLAAKDTRGKPFSAGETVNLVDKKGRMIGIATIVEGVVSTVTLYFDSEAQALAKTRSVQVSFSPGEPSTEPKSWYKV